MFNICFTRENKNVIIRKNGKGTVMEYKGILPAKFISRPNRFIAHVEIDGKEEICHVKNTGRCKELLIPGADVYVQKSDNPDRKTKYDLISVYKGDMLINIDSQAPNKIFREWAEGSGYFKNMMLIRPECKYKNSRFDFYVETDSEKIFVEVKGVTLEKDGVVSFPDAPTERGVKHINELISAKKEGYGAYIFFIIQMAQCKYFTPNKDTHKEFADALYHAQKSGVNVVALNCEVTPHGVRAREFVVTRI